jgi:hypothetical protein
MLETVIHREVYNFFENHKDLYYSFDTFVLDFQKINNKYSKAILFEAVAYLLANGYILYESRKNTINLFYKWKKAPDKKKIKIKINFHAGNNI